ncbi:MAG: Flp pilus assembly complex ATPase component TadA [Bacilli bacterium]|nr:Flp pilus assembly complex ATPase component TadA [Bacilli bacterium]
MNNNMFDQIDFGPLKEYLDNEDITDISYDNDGQIHLKTLSKGIYRVENPAINNAFMEKLAFQCSNVMGKTFNMAHPFLDAESAELRLNFVHDSIATNGIACVIRKTPAKVRLEKDKIIEQKYIEPDIHDFLEYCIKGHCNIIVCGETGSGKTELVKYLASKIAEDEKVITIEDTLELHLDKIFPHRDIVAMKTNNIASYTDVLVTCMRQNPKWILLSEVRSAEAVLAVRNSISSGHYILSTIHADKAASIPNRMYSLLETSQEIEQFLATIHRYVQLGIYVRGYTDKATHNFVREIAEVTEFYVSEDNKPESNTIYRKSAGGRVIRKNPSKHLLDYLEVQGVFLPKEMELLGQNIPISEGEHEKIKQMYQSNDKPAETLLFGNQQPVSQPVNQPIQRPVGQTVQSVNSTPIVNQPAQRIVQPTQTINQNPVGPIPVQTGQVPNKAVRANENLFE